MPITVPDVEAELIDRTGPLLTTVGKDGTTVSGANASLAGPIRQGLASLSVVPASYTVLVDSDLTTVLDAQIPQLFDVSELRTLMNIQQAFLFVDFQVDRDSQKFDQIRQGLNQRIAALTAYVQKVYGVGLASPVGGSISLDFATTDEWCGEFSGWES